MIWISICIYIHALNLNFNTFSAFYDFHYDYDLIQNITYYIVHAREYEQNLGFSSFIYLNLHNFHSDIQIFNIIWTENACYWPIKTCAGAKSAFFFFKKGMRGEGGRGILIEEKKGKTFISYVIQVKTSKFGSDSLKRCTASIKLYWSYRVLNSGQFLTDRKLGDF